MTETNKTDRAVPGRTTMTTRGVNRKLLARKAAARVGDDGADVDGALEDVFPVAATGVNDGVAADATPLAEAGAASANNANDHAEGDPSSHSDVDPASTTAPVEIIESPAPADGPPAGDPSVIPAAVPESSSQSAAAALPAPAAQPAAAWSEADERALQAMLARRKAAGHQQRRGRDVTGQLIRAGDVAPNPDTVVAVIVGLVAAAGGSVGRGELIDLMARATFPHARAKPSDRDWCQGYVAGAIRNGFLASVDEASAQAGGDDRGRPHAEGSAERAVA